VPSYVGLAAGAANALAIAAELAHKARESHELCARSVLSAGTLRRSLRVPGTLQGARDVAPQDNGEVDQQQSNRSTNIKEKEFHRSPPNRHSAATVGAADPTVSPLTGYRACEFRGLRRTYFGR
jgi:hypothetical protein